MEKHAAATHEEVARRLSEQALDEDEEVVVEWKTWAAAFTGVTCVFNAYYGGLTFGNSAGATMGSFGHPELAIWMPNTYAIMSYVVQGLLGAVSDKIGRKRILIGGFCLACIGNITVAAAPNPGAVLVGDALVSGMFCNQANFFSIPAEVLPRRFRGLASTLTVSGGGLGALLGLMFSGYTIQHNTGGLGWRSTYILGACLNVLLILLIFLFYRPLESPQQADVPLRKQVDWLGAFLLLAGFGMLLIGMTLGGNSYPWSAPTVIGLLCAGAGIIGLLAVHQIFFEKHGILDHNLWTRNYCVGSFGCFVEGVVFYAVLLLYPLETTAFWENRPFFINVRLIAFFITSAFVAPIVGWYTRLTRDLKYPLLAGWALVLTGFIMFSVADQNDNKYSIGALTIIGVGFSTPLALLFAVSQLATPPSLLGLATGQLLAARAVGQAVGASILVAVYKAKATTLVPAAVAPAVEHAGLPAADVSAFITALETGNATLIEAVPNVTPSIIEAGAAAATTATVKSFHYGWYTALPFAILALLLVLLLSSEQIKAEMTWLVERPVAKLEHVHHDDTEHRRGSLGSIRRRSYQHDAEKTAHHHDAEKTEHH